MAKLCDEIETDTMNIKSHIIVHHTKLPDGTTLKEKVEAKFNVIVTDSAVEIDNSDTRSNRTRDSKGKFNKNTYVKFNFVNNKRYINEVNDYQIQVTGTQMPEAINYIRHWLSGIGMKNCPFPRMKTEGFNEVVG